MATNGINSFVILLYADDGIQWTTGDTSGGSNGFGGTPAQVGFNAGDENRFAVVPASRMHDIVNIEETSNVGTPGIWIYRVDQNAITSSDECGVEPGGRYYHLSMHKKYGIVGREILKTTETRCRGGSMAVRQGILELHTGPLGHVIREFVVSLCRIAPTHP